VDELISTKPTIVGHCVLFLNWAEPNSATYDRDAIEMLQPVAVVALTELFDSGHGGAGSELFHNWREMQCYALVKEARADDGEEIRSVASHLDLRLTWWQRRDQPPQSTGTLRDLYASHIRLNQDCVIQ